jgi:leucyl aminopeptidase
LGAFRDGIPVADAARASVEGALLGVYQFREHKGDPEPSRAIETWTLVDFDHDAAPAVEAACEKARIVADAVLLARRWVNLGPNVLSPARFADEAVEQAAQAGLRSTVFDEDALRALGMHTVLAVARGSALAPRFLTLDYAPPGAEDEAPALLLIGKGVTFDSGGYSIKPADAMITMKGDMAGAAAVICAMLAIARLKPARRVIALTPMVENMVSANAFRPGDVITSMRGLTIEITNTDAEGRLILCDALHYAKRFAPEAVVDIATLTATSALAMGDGIAATLMTNDDGLAEAIQAAGESNGERFWRMPLYPEHLERMKSEVADIKNSGGARSGLGASGSFLKRFVDGEGRYPWAHIDMAGMGIGSDTKGYLVRGGTGFGVRSLIDLALRLAR